ncbi:TetR/AcrR family transcriptional regulator [Paenibacillus sp. ACRRX]|uniref:TetR/AcrR family transcriptional regulator n=1 Tax=Paenibacillus sp. ACRRX TaxID=2918206 RepID=UPI001EF70ACA|nr:TetR/AcrR family transcriptional regulator [Paenibacillus sp. ACRRX]MCG7406618.1 TetR/AcrR family transcriptional regulator [Paenibacillus sp. ACRRX]
MSEDIRVYKTKLAIKRGFIELLQQQHFKEITIKNICDQALIGRSTFYSHYLDKYDLLEKMVQQHVLDFTNEIKQRFDSIDEGKVADAIEFVTDTMIEHQIEISTLLEVHEETADLRKEFEHILFRTCLDYLTRHFSSSTIALDYLAELYAANSIVFLNRVLRHGKEPPIILLANQMQQYIFGQLKPNRMFNSNNDEKGKV